MIADSTRAHLLSDVPVATFLSGGLDSSYLTALAARFQPGISAYTIGFRAEDAKFEAMPDDLKYARVVAEKFGVDLHEIEIAPQVLDLLPKMTYHLDEPIGDPAAINTYLICMAAREAGVKVMLSGMGADELFAGYRKHFANLLALRYQQVPGLVRRPIETVVDRLPVATARRGYRSVRFAKRFLSFAELPEETAFRRSYTMYDRAELLDLVNPDLLETVDDVLTEHADTYNDNALSRPREPDVPGRRAAVPAGAEPRLHRPVEHGRVHRGARAVRRRRGRQGRVPHPRQGKDRRPAGQGGAQAGRGLDPAEGDRLPAQGPVQRAAAGVDEPRPGAAGARGRQRGPAGALRLPAARRRCSASSPRTPPASRTGPSTSGTC